MGGIILYCALMMGATLWARFDRFVVLFLACATVLAIVGYVDDHLKALGKKREGITPAVKMIAASDAVTTGIVRQTVNLRVCCR